MLPTLGLPVLTPARRHTAVRSWGPQSKAALGTEQWEKGLVPTILFLPSSVSFKITTQKKNPATLAHADTCLASFLLLCLRSPLPPPPPSTTHTVTFPRTPGDTEDRPKWGSAQTLDSSCTALSTPLPDDTKNKDTHLQKPSVPRDGDTGSSSFVSSWAPTDRPERPLSPSYFCTAWLHPPFP